MEQINYILKTNHICKKYGSIVALNDVSLNFSETGIYGLWGRNGAGKTTFLDIITSRIFADSGSVTCLGKDLLKNSKIMADICCYMPEQHYFPARIKVKKLLSYGKMSFPNFDEDYAQRVCKQFKLNVEQKYGNLSRGYKSIFRIVLGLAAKAKLTIFDEPVLGLDAAARDMFYLELIEEFSKNPRLFIVSTHLIEESVDLFNEAIIIKNGEIILQAPVEDLHSKAFYVSGKSTLVDEFIQNRHVMSCEAVNEIKMAVVEGDLDEEKHLAGLNYSPITIQKLFINLTNDTEKEEAYA